MKGVINSYTMLAGKPEGKTHFEGRGLDGRITLRCILKK
jgi:hypothetical protein